MRAFLDYFTVSLFGCRSFISVFSSVDLSTSLVFSIVSFLFIFSSRLRFLNSGSLLNFLVRFFIFSALRNSFLFCLKRMNGFWRLEVFIFFSLILLIWRAREVVWRDFEALALKRLTKDCNLVICVFFLALSVSRRLRVWVVVVMYLS